jgi:hypothetical protein
MALITLVACSRYIGLFGVVGTERGLEHRAQLQDGAPQRESLATHVALLAPQRDSLEEHRLPGAARALEIFRGPRAPMQARLRGSCWLASADTLARSWPCAARPASLSR